MMWGALSDEITAKILVLSKFEITLRLMVSQSVSYVLV
jgi:hypothetical protein